MHVYTITKPAAAPLDAARPSLEAQPPAYSAQPPMVVAPQEDKQEWNTSLLGCCADCNAAKITATTLLCPCVAYGKIRDRTMHLAVAGIPNPEPASCSAPCAAYALMLSMPHVGPIAAGTMRSVQRMQLRSIFNIAGNGFKDTLAGFFCGPCSLVQMRRELDIREEGQLSLGENEEPVIVVVDSEKAPLLAEEALPEYTSSETDVQGSHLA